MYVTDRHVLRLLSSAWHIQNEWRHDIQMHPSKAEDERKFFLEEINGALALLDDAIQARGLAGKRVSQTFDVQKTALVIARELIQPLRNERP